ncbi:MAG TPA: choice-of-anchor Q domain-containing protein [Polyangiaceae bacterium]|nr:choice-of-anchor Q domain-containing protein [Polyangiaceae bacterium]
MKLRIKGLAGVCRVVVAAGIAVSLMGVAARAEAATLTVATFSDSTANDGVCSLREAVRAANLSPINGDCGTGSSSGNTIVLNAGTAGGAGTYVLSSSTQLNVSRTLTIQGPNTWTTTIRVDTTGSRGIGVVAPAGNLTLRNVTLTKGSQANVVSGLVVTRQQSPQLSLTLDHVRVMNFDSSGIVNDAGNLFVSYSTISNNSNNGDGGGIAMFSAPDLGISSRILMDHSAVVGNFSNGNGGGLSRATEGHDNSRIENSTFTDNDAAQRGGGIFSWGTNSSYLALNHVTIAYNSAGVSGGGFTEDQAVGSIQTSKCILNDNMAPQGMDIEGTSFVEWSIITNLDELHTDFNIMNCRVGTAMNARLGALMFAGGPTQVLPLTPVAPPQPSPAIDFGDPADTAPVDDQRGYGRPKNGNGGSTAIMDVGAYEYDPAPTIFQSENEPMLAKSSDTYSVVSNASYSGGKGVNLASDANGDFVIFPVGVLVSGTYNVKVRVKKGSNEGIFQLSRSPSINGTQTAIGSTQDLYSSSNSWVELNLSSTVPLSAGQTYFKFAVTGKNASSTGRQLFIDYVKLTKL